MKAMLHADLRAYGGDIPPGARAAPTLRDVFDLPGFREAAAGILGVEHESTCSDPY